MRATGENEVKFAREAGVFHHLTKYQGEQDDLEVVKMLQISRRAAQIAPSATLAIDARAKALKAEGIEPRACTDEELALLNTQEEIDLIRHLSSYTDEIVAAAKDYDPARITRYVITLATLFHKFYNTCRVKDEEDHLRAARICLCEAAATVIRNVLSLLKISAPESM